MQQAETTGPVAATGAISLADPVFVLCNGRSGSTLLRFLLDAHPEIACPPETNVPALMAQLATVWSLIEGAPLSANRGDEPPEIPDAAIAGVRAAMDQMLGSYLTRRGKKRYCDKSLGTAGYAELILRVYPDARFLCLYRHPMDVISSGLEACPWGLTGYGFDPYIATSPGNAVLALARFWADNVTVTMAAEERFPGRCLRVRYEDLVTDPEAEAARIFTFLEAAPTPGITGTCFSSDRERSGPADYKIWYTSRISPDSVGRGWSIPIAMIAPPVLAQINELVGKLGYVPIDGGWGTSAPPADLRALAVDVANGQSVGDGRDVAENVVGSEDLAAIDSAPLEPTLSALLGRRLLAGVQQAAEATPSRWGPHGDETVVAVWVPDDPGQASEHWLVDLKARTVTFVAQAAQEHSVWDIVGSGRAWEQVISGRLNLSVALRACQLRYCDSDEAGPLASETRITLLATLLGLTTW